MGTAFHSGGLEESVPTFTAPLSVVVTASGLQAAGPLPGAFLRTTFALLYPPLPCDLLHTMPFLSTTTTAEINIEKQYSLVKFCQVFSPLT